MFGDVATTLLPLLATDTVAATQEMTQAALMVVSFAVRGAGMPAEAAEKLRAAAELAPQTPWGLRAAAALATSFF